MKHLLAIFLVSLALQPMDLQACSMDVEEPQGHHASMQDPHESDCCKTQPDNDNWDNGCSKATPCSLVSSVVPVIPINSSIIFAQLNHRFKVISRAHHTGPPSTPLYRPPIA